MNEDAQATGAYLTPELHLVRRDHPVLYFHLTSTCRGEISQGVREKLPLSIIIW
jgi:hypothetical protein